MKMPIPKLAELVFGGGVDLGNRPLIVFSGEGESLIVARLAAHYRIPAHGLHVATDYGRFWCLDRVAYARWRKLLPTQPFYVHRLPRHAYAPEDGEDNSVYYFSHRFSITPTYDQPFSYTAEPSVVDAITRLCPTSALMGIREDDLYRHLVHRSGLSQLLIDETAAWLRPRLEKGEPVPTEAPWPENLPLYWPLFTLSTAHKDALLEYITPDVDDCIPPAPVLDADSSPS